MGPWRWWLLVGIVLVLATPAASFTTGELPRVGDARVVADETGTLGLDVASSVSKNTVEPLINVTNSVGVDLTVTVALLDGTQGDLYVNGMNQGAVATITVASGATATVNIDAQGSANTQLSFDVTATRNGIDVTAPGRSTTITGGGGGGGGGGGNACNNPNPPPKCP